MKNPILLVAVLLGFGAACGRQSPDASTARLLVRGATVRALVETLDGLEATIARKVTALGGFTTASELTGTGNNAALTVVFRVPAERLDVAMTTLESLAKRVDSRQVKGEDFTEEYVDLEAQRTNLTATRDRLHVLLDKATRVEDALEVNKGLTEVQGQLEKIAGRTQYLQQASALSTVTATFYPESNTTVRSDEWRPLEVARVALSRLLAVLQFLGSAVIVMGVFVPLWGPPVWFLRRRRARARAT
ncbi:MAG: DUF4349 domain-containing protein [Archangium sp.]|nr:DUF4349 domain-containing protein [Archangium sp.]MDP3569670.1 DUF4349 domain-containing protein [Archangium sp.]